MGSQILIQNVRKAKKRPYESNFYVFLWNAFGRKAISLFNSESWLFNTNRFLNNFLCLSFLLFIVSQSPHFGDLADTDSMEPNLWTKRGLHCVIYHNPPAFLKALFESLRTLFSRKVIPASSYPFNDWCAGYRRLTKITFEL
jgi:hypothetical protein